MKNYDLNTRMILRIPRFPINKSDTCLDEILKDPVFRDALYLASDAVVCELGRNKFQLNNCSEKMKHSLMRYHKRICYRPTPFGAFAGINVFTWNETENPGIVVNQESFRTLVIKKNLSDQTRGLKNEQCYRVNPFLYPYGNDYRVLRKDEKNKETSYTITEIFGSDVIRKLASINQTISQSNLVELLQSHYTNKNDLNWYMQEIINLQIILPLSEVKSNIFPNPLNREQKELPGSSYDSYCRVSATGSLSHGIKHQLRNAIYCLDKLSCKYEPKALNQFKDRFKKLFDRKEVPLLQALDPELGIDYAGLSTTARAERETPFPESISWSPVHELLLGKWTMHAGHGIPEIELMEKDVAQLDNPAKINPPGSAIMFSVLGDKVLIKAAGGVSGLNMIGRFTVLCPDILHLANEIAKNEMGRNPDVIFAEISHLDNMNFSSVTKRAMVYDYNIPFFEAPQVPDDFVIGLNDLYISIVNDCLYLRSARLKKRIIPRFSSAYNYQNSPLPPFRFLCDLQYEGTDTIMNFSMANLFPGLPAYPRITYKGVILEAASWYLDAKCLSELKRLDQKALFSAFRKLAGQVGLPNEFCYVMHDQLLYIKLSCEKDICLLLNSIPSSGKIILKEYDKRQETLVKNTHGNSFTHEWIAILMNREKSYISQIRPSVSLKSGIHKDKLFPFDEWLYFKIYLHPAGYTDLLVKYIHPFVSENFRQENISSWFFISYCDQNFHLRVRLKQMPGRETKLLEAYKKLEQRLRQLPNLKRIELSTYKPEMERYAVIGIQRAEELFQLSSEIVLANLRLSILSHYSERDKLFSAIKHVFLGCLGIGLDYHKIEEVSKSLTGHLTKSQKIEFDLEFREQKRDLRSLMIETENGIIEKKYMARLRTLAEPLNPDEKLHLITDLNHMHLNRHYLHDQSFFEVKTYYFLCKITRLLISYQIPFYDLKKKFCSLS